MKVRFAVAVAATLFAGAMTMAADGSWTGWISDSQCGVKGANDKAGECTTKCVKEHGAKSTSWTPRIRLPRTPAIT